MSKKVACTVTSPFLRTNSQMMVPGLTEISVPKPSQSDLDHWMVRFQQADPDAPGALVRTLSPALLHFFRSQFAIREQADDLLQETWLRIHRVRHTYRPGEPALPWVYAIARRVGIDAYRKKRRITLHERAMEVMPERAAPTQVAGSLPEFDMLVAALPEAQREVLTMMKVGGLSLEEVARATCSTVGAVKQKAHRAYEKLRNLLEAGAVCGLKGGA